jgi:predicted nuclease with TOPRIM domain
MKTTLSITITPETLQAFQKIVEKGNLSKEIEQYMNRIVQAKTITTTYQDLEILQKELALKQTEYDKIANELHSMQQQKEAMTEQQKREEIAQLELEKQNIMEKETCVKCVNTNMIKKYYTPKGNICGSCFMTLTSTEARALGL